MKTYSEFDYGLWTTQEQNGKKYWARIKITGEVIEISAEIMRYLNLEDKRMRRHIEEATAANVAVYSIDTPTDDGLTMMDTVSDSFDLEEDITNKMLIHELKNQLSSGQLNYFIEVFEHGKTLSEYAKEHGISPAAAHKRSAKIANKLKKISEGG